MAVDFDPLGFAPTYRCEEAFLPPAGGPVIQFVWRRSSRSTASYGTSGLLIRVEVDEARKWLGLFEIGISGLTGLYCGPTSRHLCVVAHGNAYVLEAKSPSR